MNSIYLTSYGDKEGNNKGIILLQNNQQFCCPLNGKANMVIHTDGLLITSIKEKDGAYLELYDEGLNRIKRIKTKYHYSYGQKIGNQLYLASFESGADAWIDLSSFEEKTYLHTSNTYPGTGRSHYIQKIGDNICSVDNAFEQIYIFNQSLEMLKVVEFNEELSLRLMSINKEKRRIYLNTEKTNELITLDFDFNIIHRLKLSEQKCFSGGNAIKTNGESVFVTLRGINQLVEVDVRNDEAKIKRVIETLEMPRDLLVVDKKLYCTTTKANCIEIYDINTLEKEGQIEVAQPITFEMK